MSDVGQIGLVRTTGFWSVVIRVVTASNWNHNVVFVGDVYDTHGHVINDAVVSAEGSGVTIMQRDDFPGAVWSQFELTPTQQMAVKAFNLDQLGKPYGYWTDFWIGVAHVFKAKTPKWIETKLSDQSTWICSQIADASYTAAGYPLFTDNRPTGSVWPGSLAKIFVTRGWTDKP